MKNFKIALFYCDKAFKYKLVTVDDQIDPEDPCLLWVFDSSKIKVAQKIVRNMNLAGVTNPDTGFSLLA